MTRARRRVRAAGLVAPRGAQGPGPMPSTLVDALDLAVRRRVAGPLPGEHLAAGVGAGVELAQLRAYQPGDDVRQLDPAATARTRVPHVRVHVPERAPATWLVLDRSPSMAFGTRQRLKIDVAQGVAEVVGRLATRRGGRLGLVTCGEGHPALSRTLPARGGRGAETGLRRAIGEGVASDGPTTETLEAALRRLGRIARTPGVVVVVSDFLGDDVEVWRPALAALRGRHDLLCLEIRDPREDELPDVGVLWFEDAESGRQVQVDTSDRDLRRSYAAAAAERRGRVAAALRRARVRHAVLRTDGPWLRDLGMVLR